MPCSRATRCGGSRTISWATGRIGRRWPHSTSAATSVVATRFVDPDRLREGWRLRLPADVDRRAGDDAARAGNTHTRRATQASRPEPDGHLPELLALGLGSLACAALARRAASRRRVGTRFSGDPVLQPRAIGGRTGRGDPAAALQRCPGAAFLRGRQLPAGPVPRRRSLPPDGPGHLRLGLRRHVLFRRGASGRASRGLRAREGRHRVARQPRCPRGSRPLLPVPSRRASHRRRRRGHLARPPRTGRCAARPRRGGSGALARRPRRRRLLGLVGDGPRDRGSEDAALRAEAARRSAPGSASALLRGPGDASGRGGRSLCRGHHATGRRERPDRPGRSPGRHHPPHGPGRPTAPPIGGDGRADCRAGRAAHG